MKKGGSGGANTNKTGLKFEKSTSLKNSLLENTELSVKEHIIPKEKCLIHSSVKSWDIYKADKHIGIITSKSAFYNIIYELFDLKNNNYKKWEPDEVFINLINNTCYIIEKKFQNGSGSVDEKIFGFNAKRLLYQNIFNQLTKEPVMNVSFIALFNSSWWIRGETLDESNNVVKTAKINYHDYFNILRNDGIKIMFDNYDYKFLGL